jgi:hypothetical protein
MTGAHPKGNSMGLSMERIIEAEEPYSLLRAGITIAW